MVLHNVRGHPTEALPIKRLYTSPQERVLDWGEDLGITLRAGVCRPCDTIELTATSCNFSLCRRVEKVCVDRQLFRYS